MDDGFGAKVESRLGAYRNWTDGRDLRNCRLVQYVGVEMLGANDVPLGDVESQIQGLVCEGFQVDWAPDCNRMYLRAWESGGPEPPWPRVLAEEHLADIDGILIEKERSSWVPRVNLFDRRWLGRSASAYSVIR